MMIKKLARHGNSLALVIEKGILEILNIDSETLLEISTDGSSLRIIPVRDEKRKKEFQKEQKSKNKIKLHRRVITMLEQEGERM